MTQFGEGIAVALARDIDDECPFKLPDPPAVSEEDEDVARDDRSSTRVAAVQRNSGGKLGSNLTSASPGAPGTINDLFPAPTASPKPAIDTKRNDGGMVNVKGDSAEYPYAVAAHHLIPGEASLAKSSLYKQYMKKGGKIKTRSGRQYTVKEHIGYNVNGAHNGVWLPGNYAIRRATSPKRRVSWGKLGPEWEDWKFNYMRACVRKAKGQFHDTHATYSRKVLGMLDKMYRVLVVHQDVCDECKGKNEIPPPYMLKARLYGFSKFLEGKLRLIPRKRWKVPFYTSDRFRAQMIKAGMLDE